MAKATKPMMKSGPVMKPGTKSGPVKKPAMKAKVKKGMY